MNSNDWLASATETLTSAGIGTARLDSLVLLEDATGKDKAWLLAHPELTLTAKQIAQLTSHISLRSTHVPLAYVRGKTEFYGREFIINAHVLEPRPESETMLDLLKQTTLSKAPRIADVGCGSGALGITAALELPGAIVHLFDIDPKTISVAKENAQRYKLSLKYFESDLLNAHNGAYDVLLCNLPYVPDHFTINEAAAMEPRVAIFGGPDGLALYRKLFEQLQTFDWKPQYILCESMPMQHKSLMVLAHQHGYTFVREEDFIKVFTAV